VHILGIQPDYDGLRVNPCIPPEWEGYQVSRKFRGATYKIRVRNPEFVSKGVKTVKVDGRTIEGSLIPIAAPGTSCQVEVVLG
jgi:cellobiose phosphorylase